MKKINVTIFAGGRGCAKLIKYLYNTYANVNLKIIVNCYDDGKSTGELRNLLQNFLGPSDIRKNISNFLDKSDHVQSILAEILNYRFSKFRINELKNFLKLFEKKYLKILPKNYYEFIYDYIFEFYQKFKNNNKQYKDFSLGNIIFAGIYLKKKSFNNSATEFNRFFLNDEIVYNVTNGESLWLSAIRENNIIAGSESEIVSFAGDVITDLVLTKKKYLPSYNTTDIQELLKLSVIPKINKKIIPIILNSDLIIYGPGTQHSSLFPSYLTKGLSKYIKKSKAKKFLISNIFYDYDIINYNFNRFIDAFFYYFSNYKINNKNNNYLVDYILVNEIDNDDLNLKKENYFYNKITHQFDKIKIIYSNFEKINGIHLPKTTIENIFKAANLKYVLKQNIKLTTISIIVPVLNEKRTIKQVLMSLQKVKINFDNNVLYKEIIVVDSGSKDGTLEILKNMPFVRLYSILKNKKNLLNGIIPGKGEAIRFGIKKSKGEIIVIFPSDNEYKVDEICEVIKPIYKGEAVFVNGSRIINCLNITSRLKKIYQSNYYQYILSRFGSILLSVLSILLSKRFVSDPLSTFKAFDAKFLKKIKIVSNNWDFDTEIINKTANRNKLIREVPVFHAPRNKNKGKKINIYYALQSILGYFKN
jgi:2-phospho-L-lactate transferase/gluconeogenesis factor (CofD/UPF0052 family)